jgi:hypothetical protein
MTIVIPSDPDRRGKTVNPLFQFDSFVIKRKKLSTDKMRVFSSQGDFLMYAEQKITWKPPFTATIRVYADELKQQEILVATDAGGREYENFLEVTDPVSGESVGGIGLAGGWVKDGWKVMDSQGNMLAEVKDRNLGRSLVRIASRGIVHQKLAVTMGGEIVAEMRQKRALLGNHLLVDNAPGTSAKLDPRLLLAASVLVAAYLAKEDMD